jgi:hypothetical protein
MINGLRAYNYVVWTAYRSLCGARAQVVCSLVAASTALWLHNPHTAHLPAVRPLCASAHSPAR